MDQELLLRASFLEQQSKELHENLELLDSQIQELSDFSLSLDFLINSDKKEVLSNLGKGVYLSTNISDKKLFVQVGSGIVVRKTPEDTKKIIESQLLRLQEARFQLISQIEIYNSSLRETISNIEKSMEKKQKQ